MSYYSVSQIFFYIFFVSIVTYFILYIYFFLCNVTPFIFFYIYFPTHSYSFLLQIFFYIFFCVYPLFSSSVLVGIRGRSPQVVGLFWAYTPPTPTIQSFYNKSNIVTINKRSKRGRRWRVYYFLAKLNNKPCAKLNIFLFVFVKWVLSWYWGSFLCWYSTLEQPCSMSLCTCSLVFWVFWVFLLFSLIFITYGDICQLFEQWSPDFFQLLWSLFVQIFCVEINICVYLLDFCLVFSSIVIF